MKIKPKSIALLGICAAIAMVLSYIESLIPLSFAVPGIKLGLANIAIIAVMIRYGIVSGLLMTLLRSGFVFLTRGVSAAVMSLSGGLLAFAAAAVLMIIMKRSCKFSCIIAAMCHTLGQLAAACVLTGSVYTLAYVVVLMPVSIFTGFLTGTVLQALQGFLDDRKVVK